MRYLKLLLIVLCFLSACRQEKPYGGPLVKTESILKNVMNYLVYNDRYVQLFEEFKALDASAKTIDKESFLQQLTTGKFLPLRLQSFDSTTYYQLHPLPSSAEQGISTAIKRYAETDLAFFKMEGKNIPDFSFADLQGNELTKNNTKGKTLVLKCWFINCVPCVKEMPDLNKIVAEYKDNSNILFVSLALDNAEKLKAFMNKTEFSYAVVPNQSNYINDELGITSFPTHLIVDKEGKIAKVVSNHTDLRTALNSLTSL